MILENTKISNAVVVGSVAPFQVVVNIKGEFYRFYFHFDEKSAAEKLCANVKSEGSVNLVFWVPLKP